MLAEAAAERALGEGARLIASDLDIRYLSRLKTGPLVASVEAVRSERWGHAARVRLTDGHGGPLVSFVSLTMTPAG
jgi:acyl-coenzyme A thioesterase PaaI-like protein